MRTERKKHHKSSDPAMALHDMPYAETLPIEIEPFEVPTPTKAEVKAQEERARKKTAKALEIKKAKEKKKAEELRHQLAIKKELSKSKKKSSQN